MIARIFASLGFPVAGVGFTVFGMATSESVRNDSQADLGLALLIGGMVVGMIGVIMYRASEAKS